MKDVMVLLLLLTTVLTFLATGADGLVPSNGHCIGNQCFAAFHVDSRFAEAQSNCAETGGHLMTLRSTVSHNILPILMPEEDQRYWFGLHLESGCPDEATELRGFRWVTGEGEESDFYNWAGSFDGSCSSKCVSVSAVDGFKWRQQPCDVLEAGFLCEYRFENPCTRLDTPEGQRAHYSLHYGFEGEDFLSLPPGSMATLHPSETKHICEFGRWVKAPWTCEIYEGGCEHQCVKDRQDREYVCFCPPGQVVNPDNNVTCEVARDDPCVPLSCEQACYKRDDAYVCRCDHGFELAEDGRSCRDIDDCADERQCPEDNHKCENTIGGFQCVCRDGYRAVDDKCLDVDECASAPCEHMCENTPGSYACSCFEGYITMPDTPHRCKLHCGLPECPAECDPNDRYQCDCPLGYIVEERGDAMFCIDINECEMFSCDQLCKNFYGSFVCSCSAGFALVNGYRCDKMEEDKDKDTDEDKDPTDRWEGSGVTTPYLTVTPSVKYTEPTGEPSTITAGGLLAIIVCVVLVILVMVFLAHHILKRRGSSRAGLKGPGDEGHDLERVASENKCEQTSTDLHSRRNT